jgi:hypothetical protein
MLKNLFGILSMIIPEKEKTVSKLPSKPEPPKEEPKLKEWNEIDWSNEKDMVSKYFSVRNAIWLPEWKRLGNLPEDKLTDEVKQNLVKTFRWMDTVREILGIPIKVHLAFRSMAYHLDLYRRLNEQRKKQGKPDLRVPMKSAHLMGNAVDFSSDMGKGSVGANCDEIKSIMKPRLEELKLRLEDNGKGANWIHLDSNPPGPSGRFFKP